MGIYLKYAIVPIIKNKPGDSSNINNYRRIALVRLNNSDDSLISTLYNNQNLPIYYLKRWQTLLYASS